MTLIIPDGEKKASQARVKPVNICILKLKKRKKEVRVKPIQTESPGRCLNLIPRQLVACGVGLYTKGMVVTSDRNMW